MELHEAWPFSDYPEKLLIAPERELQLHSIATRYKTFPKFSLLPKELRTMIWDYTMPPRLVEIRSILHKDGYFYFRPCRRGNYADYSVEQLYLVCAESKNFIKNRYLEIRPKNPFFPIPFRINPQKDILLFRGYSDFRDIRFGEDRPMVPSYLAAFAKRHPQLAKRLRNISIEMYEKDPQELQSLTWFPYLQDIVMHDHWECETYRPDLGFLEKTLQNLKAHNPKLKMHSIRLVANRCNIVYPDLQLGWPDGYVHPEENLKFRHSRKYTRLQWLDDQINWGWGNY